MIWQIHSTGSADTERLGRIVGSLLRGGEIIELCADLGGGKTTFTRGLARGLRIAQNITSPTFTLTRTYKGRDNIELKHFDFYRLSDAGILSQQLAESINETDVVTVVEWGEIINNLLPASRLQISFSAVAGDSESRDIEIRYPEGLAELIQKSQSMWESSKP